MLASAPARAYEPEMDYWFVETFTLEKVDLPEGVTIHPSGGDTSPRRYLILQNTTDTLLFVMSLNYKEVLVMPTPDPGWKTRLSLAHEAASYLIAPDKMASLSMEALTHLDPNLEDRNVLTSDPPPAGLAIPEAQHSELLLVCGDQVIESPFTISYALNTEFDNGSEVINAWMETVQATDHANATATQQALILAAKARDSLVLISLAGLVLLTLIVWIGWKGFVRRG
ncbi:MAG TPA: hypothetical protein VLD65_07295 [Anaerolineales bacterium]|nr:hypothetical protein [Anaerolineales bacterium]